MNNTPVTAEDLYLYAMGLMDAEEQKRMDAFLLQSPEARAELANVYGDLALLSLTVEAQTPPALTRQRLLKQVGRERKTQQHAAAQTPATAPTVAAISPTDAEQIPSASRLSNLKPIQPESYGSQNNGLQEDNAQQDAERSFRSQDAPLTFRSSYENDEPVRRRGFAGSVLPWAGWAVAAGLAVSTGLFYEKASSQHAEIAAAQSTAAKANANAARAEQVLDTLKSSTAQRFVLTKQSVTPVPSARVMYVAENGSLVFQGNNLDPLPPYKTYELWLIPVGEGRQPIPAGTFKPDERGYASIILPELPKGVVAGTFGVTMEDDGGSTTPTLPILMIGS